MAAKNRYDALPVWNPGQLRRSVEARDRPSDHPPHPHTGLRLHSIFNSHWCSIEITILTKISEIFEAKTIQVWENAMYNLCSKAHWLPGPNLQVKQIWNRGARVGDLENNVSILLNRCMWQLSFVFLFALYSCFTPAYSCIWKSPLMHTLHFLKFLFVSAIIPDKSCLNCGFAINSQRYYCWGGMAAVVAVIAIGWWGRTGFSRNTDQYAGGKLSMQNDSEVLKHVLQKGGRWYLINFST